MTQSAMRRAWLIVGLLWVVALLNYVDRQIITAMSKPIETDLGIQHAKFGLFSSTFLWVYGILSPFAGWVADRVSRKKVIILSLFVWSGVTCATGYVKTFDQMILARAAMGISEAFYIPAALALIVDFHRDRTRSLATGLHLSGAYTGSVLGGLGGWIAETSGWRFGFKVFGIVGVVYAIILLFTLKTDHPKEEQHAQPGPESKQNMATAIRELLGIRMFLILLMVNACVGAAFWTIKSWLPAFFNTEMNKDLTMAGIYGGMFFYSAAFIGMLIAGTIADKWSRNNLRARTLVPALAFLVTAPCFFAVGLVKAVPLILAAIVIVGMAQGAIDANLMPSLCTIVSSKHHATGYGMLNFVSTITGGVMIYVGGLLKDAKIPFTVTFQIAALIILCAGCLLLAIKPRHSNSG